MEGIYTKKMVCPVCKQDVDVPRLKHGAYTIISRDSDLHPWVSGVNPTYYLGVICPNCGYAALESHFEELKPDELKKLLPLLAKKRLTGTKSITVERTWDDALFILLSVYEQYEVRGSDPYNLGYIAQNIAWLYREKKDNENEQTWLQKSVDYYLQAYETSADLPSTLGEAGLGYLIADIYSRLGQYRDALQWASRVVQMPKNRKKVLFDQLSRELWQNLRENYKSGSNEEVNWNTTIRSEIQSFFQSEGLLTSTFDKLIKNIGLWASGENLQYLDHLKKEDVEAIASFEWFDQLKDVSKGHKLEGDAFLMMLLPMGTEEPTVYLLPDAMPDSSAIVFTNKEPATGMNSSVRVLWHGYGFLKGTIQTLYIVEVRK